MTFWDWAAVHWWLGFWIVFWAMYFACQLLRAVLFQLPNRFIRGANIRHAGWPPAYLDADGDFRPVEAED